MIRRLLDRLTPRALPSGSEDPWYSEALGHLESIERHVVVLVPKEPYVAWLRSLGEDDMTLERVREDLTVFLVPVTEDRDSDFAHEFVDQHFGRFFAQELEQWHLDRKRWPKRRTRAMFHEWFEVVVHGMVLDTAVVPTRR